MKACTHSFYRAGKQVNKKQVNKFIYIQIDLLIYFEGSQ